MVEYNGTVPLIGKIYKEDKDFGFIRIFSNTCKISDNEERRILDKNRSKIAYNVYRAHGFTTQEIKKLYDEFENHNDEKNKYFTGWLRKIGNRHKELGDIKYVIGMLPNINDMLKCNMKDRHSLIYASIIGIIEGNDYQGGSVKYARLRCSDSCSILEFFPGYFENKELWDYWRTHTVNHDTFFKVVRGEYPNYLIDYKNQKTIEDAWG